MGFQDGSMYIDFLRSLGIRLLWPHVFSLEIVEFRECLVVLSIIILLCFIDSGLRDIFCTIERKHSYNLAT